MKTAKLFLAIMFLLSSSILFSQENKDSLLIESIKAGQFDKAKELVEAGADVNAVDTNKATALMWATYKGDLDFVKWLVSKGSDYKKKGIIEKDNLAYGNLLGIAAAKNRVDFLRYFIEGLGIDVNDKELSNSGNDDGWTAFIYSVYNDNIESIEYLRKVNENIDSVIFEKNPQGYSFFDYAINGCDLKFLSNIVKNIKNVSFQSVNYDKLRNKILDFQNDIKKKEILDFYIKNGANIKLNEYLQIAIKFNMEDYALKLVKQGAEASLLELIYLGLEDDVIKLINKSKFTKELLDTALHLAFNFHSKKLIPEIVRAGADINSYDEFGNTILNKAILLEDIDMLSFLIDNNVDVNYKDQEGFSPLFLANSTHNNDILDLLKSKGSSLISSPTLSASLQKPNLTLSEGCQIFFVDDNLIHFWDKNGNVSVCDILLNKIIYNFEKGNHQRYRFMPSKSYRKDSKYAAIYQLDKVHERMSIVLMETKFFKVLKRFYGHDWESYDFQKIAFTSDNKFLFTEGVEDFTIRKWNIETARSEYALCSKLYDDKKYFFELGIRIFTRYFLNEPDNKVVISWGNHINTYDISDGKIIDSIEISTLINGDMQYSSTYETIACHIRDSSIILYDKNFKFIHEIKMKERFNYMSFSPDGRYLVFDNRNTQNIDLYDLKENRIDTNIISIINGWPIFSKNCKSILTYNYKEPSITVYETSTLTALNKIRNKVNNSSKVLLTDKNDVCSNYKNGSLGIWSINSNNRNSFFKIDLNISRIFLNRNKNELAIANNIGLIFKFDLNNNLITDSINLNQENIIFCDFNSDLSKVLFLDKNRKWNEKATLKFADFSDKNNIILKDIYFGFIDDAKFSNNPNLVLFEVHGNMFDTLVKYNLINNKETKKTTSNSCKIQPFNQNNSYAEYHINNLLNIYQFESDTIIKSIEQNILNVATWVKGNNPYMVVLSEDDKYGLAGRKHGKWT